MTVTQLRVCVIYYCNMLRPNSRPSSGTTNCVKYKGKYIKIALLQMRSQFHFFLSCYITGEVFIATAVKIGNTDVVSVMVNWAIQCVICSLCGISKSPINIGEWYNKQSVVEQVSTLLFILSRKIMGQHLDQAMAASYQIHSHPLLVRYSVLHIGNYWPRSKICCKWKRKPEG